MIRRTQRELAASSTIAGLHGAHAVDGDVPRKDQRAARSRDGTSPRSRSSWSSRRLGTPSSGPIAPLPHCPMPHRPLPYASLASRETPVGNLGQSAARGASRARLARATHSAASRRDWSTQQRRIGGSCASRRPCRRSCRARPPILRRRAGRRRSGTPTELAREAVDGPERRASASADAAPSMTAARMSAPVFRACMSSSAGRRAFVTDPWDPPGGGEVDRLAADHAGGPGRGRKKLNRSKRAPADIVGAPANDRGAAAARTWKASVRSPSPARIARPSPNTTCAVGRPRRSVSSSIAGRSSWTSE